MANTVTWRCDRCGAEGFVPGDQGFTYIVMREHAKVSPSCPFDADHVWAKAG